MRWPRFMRPGPVVPDTQEAGATGQPDVHRVDRERMVAEQLEARGITDPDLLRAFRTVERHAFVDDPEPYGDHALPVGSGQTISQPYVVALMSRAARPSGGWEGASVLEVGTGSGYQSALLAAMGARVTSIERHAGLAEKARARLAEAGFGERVEVVIGDGTQGWRARAPYESIMVTAGGPLVPAPLLDQLADGGRLVMPVGDRRHQVLTLVERSGDSQTTTELEGVVFVPLIGEHGYADEAREV